MAKYRLAIKLDELQSAFESASETAGFYLDLETGRIVLITDDGRFELQCIYDELGVEGGEQPGDFEAALARRGLPDWLAGMVRVAHQIDNDNEGRYRSIPGSNTYESYDDMAAFVETVSDARFRNRLAYAIQGRGAFRRFKDTLLERPAERERWFDFSAAHERERLLEWLEVEGIEIIASDEG